MNLKRVSVSILILVMFTSSVAFAGEVRGILGLGFGAGGDTIDKFDISDGDSETIKANEGFAVYGGIKYEDEDLIAIKTTLGFKFESVAASNGEASFDRMPLDTLFLLKVNQHYLGGGLTYHTDVTYKCKLDGFLGCDFAADFEKALGYVIAYEYMATLPEKNMGVLLGARYNKLEYEFKPVGFPDFTIDASGFDFYLELLFKI